MDETHLIQDEKVQLEQGSQAQGDRQMGLAGAGRALDIVALDQLQDCLAIQG